MKIYEMPREYKGLGKQPTLRRHYTHILQIYVQKALSHVHEALTCLNIMFLNSNDKLIFTCTLIFQSILNYLSSHRKFLPPRGNSTEACLYDNHRKQDSWESNRTFIHEMIILIEGIISCQGCYKKMQYGIGRCQQKCQVEQADGSHDSLKLRAHRNQCHHVEQDMKQWSMKNNGCIEPINCTTDDSHRMNKRNINEDISGISLKCNEFT